MADSGRSPDIRVGIAAGTATEQPDTGPGGTYARLADVGHAPAQFREDLRARMPEPAEARTPQPAPPGHPSSRSSASPAPAPTASSKVNEMIADASSYIFRYDSAP